MTLLIIASKCPCPYANRISEAFRVDFVHKSMRFRSTAKPTILMVLTKNHISEAFRIIVDKSMFLRSTTKPPIVSIGGGLTKIVSYEGGNRASV